MLEIIRDHATNYSPSPMYLYLAMQSVHSPLQATPYWLAQQAPLVSSSNLSLLVIDVSVLTDCL